MNSTVTDLRLRVEETKRAIIDALTEIDHIKLQENPAIEADYAVKLGYLENEVLEAKIGMLRAKRMLSMAQASVNARRPIDESVIATALDAEFARWQEDLATSVGTYFKMLEYRNSMMPMAPEDSRELKRLYRLLAKRFHPDVNPEQTAEDVLLFAIAQSAYASGDLDSLRSLYATLDTRESDAEPLDELELSATSIALSAQLDLHKKTLDDLKRERPYCLKEKLADPKWVADRVQKLQQVKSGYARCTTTYTARYKELVKR